jgi:hypothetical protein
VTGRVEQFFLDFEVAGHRVIIFPSWFKATLVGHPLHQIFREVRLQDTQPFSCTTNTPEEPSKMRLCEHLREYLEHSKE